MNSKPLGILGGTFDPVHCAHLRLAGDACTQLGLDEVVWIPAGHPPHRAAPAASAEQRLAMVSLAIRGDSRFHVDDSEVRATVPSYTVDTLQRLREQHGARPLVLLLGADAFLGLPSWHRWHELFSLAHIAVATRPGYALEPNAMADALREEYGRRYTGDVGKLMQGPAGRIVTFAIAPLDISASAVREKLASGQKIDDLLPDAVLDYIAINHLYTAH